jgi:asparagine synthase (glutamine-hydrolysing)
MCGIAGLLDRSVSSAELELLRICREMTDAIAHRGPDDSGAWVDAAQGVALGHRRLSIVDLSPTGHQPMHSASGRFVVTYNGEIFNFRELRAELEELGCRFRGTSDTEVLLECVQTWGVEATLRRLNGMYAFGLWDLRERRLTLARDRFGEKPLYFAELGSKVVFGSELFAIQRCPWSDWQIDRNALAAYTRDLYVPAPLAILERVRKLPPGTFVEFDAAPSGAAVVQEYWSAREAAERASSRRFDGTFEDATSELANVLGRAVRRRMVADVPLGALLSGGIDSSTVVALMVAQADSPVRTFSIGVDDPAYDEAPYARRIAEALGTVHTERYVTQAEILRAVSEVVGVYDEPFADSSQVPTLLVSRIARQNVTVALTGDGGDEVFGGYSRYDLIPGMWRKLSAVPFPLRRAAASLAGPLCRPALRAAGLVSPRARGYGQRFYDGHEVASRLESLAAAESLEALYDIMQMQWKTPALLVRGADAAAAEPPRRPPPGSVSWPERLMYHDTVRYLPEDLLVKVDRAAMSVGLETRLPFLDPEVFEFAWSLPLAYRRKDGVGKRVLKSVLGRQIPPELFERPKMGFSIPVGQWLKEPLRDWAESLLDPARLTREGFFDVDRVRSAWRRHLAREDAWSHEIWIILQFQVWYDTFRKSRSG